MNQEAFLLILTMVVIFIITAVVPPFRRKRLLRLEKAEPVRYTREEIDHLLDQFQNIALTGRIVIRVTGEKKTASALTGRILEILRNEGIEPQIQGYKDPRKVFPAEAPEEIRYYLTKEATARETPAGKADS